MSAFNRHIACIGFIAISVIMACRCARSSEGS